MPARRSISRAWRSIPPTPCRSRARLHQGPAREAKSLGERRPQPRPASLRARRCTLRRRRGCAGEPQCETTCSARRLAVVGCRGSVRLGLTPPRLLQHGPPSITLAGPCVAAPKPTLPRRQPHVAATPQAPLRGRSRTTRSTSGSARIPSSAPRAAAVHPRGRGISHGYPGHRAAVEGRGATRGEAERLLTIYRTRFGSVPRRCAPPSNAPATTTRAREVGRDLRGSIAAEIAAAVAEKKA